MPVIGRSGSFWRVCGALQCATLAEKYRFGICIDGAYPKHANAHFLVCPSTLLSLVVYEVPSHMSHTESVLVPTLSTPATILKLGMEQATHLHHWGRLHLFWLVAYEQVEVLVEA